MDVKILFMSGSTKEGGREGGRARGGEGVRG